MARRKLTKRQNIGKWKMGINNTKEVTIPKYNRNQRGGIMLT